MAYIGLLDCNNFFVSCERLFRPDLEKKPVVVLSSNDGCVVARSKEVKELGIPMGVPYFKVRDELEASRTTIFSSNFTLYRDISARVMRVLQNEVGYTEQYSVDEAFFTLTAPTMDSLKHIKAAVEQQVGVPVTVGVAKTKTIAKCATEIGKKGEGVSLLEGSAWKEVAQTFPLADVWGIGRRTGEHMRAYNLLTVADLQQADPAFIRSEFGIAGARLQTELAEQPTDRSERDKLQQSIMSTRSFQKSTTNLRVLEDAVAYHVAHAAEELRELGACAHTIRVLIRPSRHNEWVLRGGTREAVLVIPTDDTRVILREALALVRSLYEAGVPYKKAGVILSGIVPRAAVPGSLFESSDQHHELFSAIDGLNHRYGAGTLTIGRTKTEGVWQASKSHVSPRYTTSWQELQTVVA